MDESTREIEPLPSQQAAPHLYDWATIGVIGIGVLLIASTGILALLGKAVPEFFGPALLLDLGALAGMVTVKARA